MTAGFTVRVRLRLADARSQAQACAVATDAAAAGTSTSVELVLRDKQVEIKDFYKSRSDAKGSWKGFKARGNSSATAQLAGDRAGRTARLGGEKAIGGSRTAISA